MKKIVHSAWLTLTLILVTSPAEATEPFSLLDDFSGDRIDDTLWNGVRRPDFNVLDFAREVKSGELRLMNRSYSDPNATPGTIGQLGRVRLHFRNSDPVTQILVLVRVNAMELNDCAAPATVSNIRARVDGVFFTTGGPPPPGDATNNIYVPIEIIRRSDSVDPPGVMRIQARVLQCGDVDCIGGTDVFFDDTSLGTLSPGQSALLALVWDPDNDRFIFARDSLARSTIYNYNGVLTDVDPPSTDLIFARKPRFEVRAAIETCTSGPPASGFMDVSIDKIWLNQSAVSP